DGVLGKGAGHGDGADEFSIDVDRAAAHALHDAGMFEGAAGEAGEDEGFFGAEILEDAEDFDLELVDAIAGEDGASSAAHAGANVLEGKEGRGRGLGGEGGGKGEYRRDDEAGHVLIVAVKSGEKLT